MSGSPLGPGPVVDLPGPWCTEPYLLGELGAGAVLGGFASDDALAVVVEQRGRDRGLIGLGAPAALAPLAAAVGREPGLMVGVRFATLTRGAWELLGPDDRTGLGLADGASHWDWFWTDAPLVGTDRSRAERLPLTPGTTAAVAACLGRAHPTASTPPDDERLLGWWGARHDGRLVAVAGAVTLGPGLSPHLVSLGVDPDHRGRGLAGAVLAATVADCLAVRPEVGEPMVSLGMYADNQPARRVYLRHGFRLRHEFASRRPVG
ncbi:GNAT family N-acetyltransferase [Actinotalea sp. AC32]|nr:GNAT family N-acetyltransferase [Actinotalea sp. AC32]